ncbi:MAG: extracellular solute-binding protein [Treponema sp.]|nr:extracellular solute-binding protein [Treponema sp.]
MKGLNRSGKRGLCILFLFVCAISAFSCSRPKTAGTPETGSVTKTRGAADTGRATDAGAAADTGYSDIVTAPGVFPIVKAPYTLRIFTSQAPTIENFTTNAFTKSYEEKTGVHIEWEVAPANSVWEKLNLSLTTGDYCDMYVQTGMSKQMEILYGSQGVFIPLNDLIEKYAPNIAQAFREHPEIRAMNTAPDGNLYSLPVLNTAPIVRAPCKLWMNTTWLKNLNLKVPQTTEEFYQVLKAFKERDPNGNGSGKNVIPFFCADDTKSFFVEYFMNSFIQCNQGNQGFMYVTDDDKVGVAYDKPEWRDGLMYLRRLVRDGLMDPASFSANQDELKRVAENPGNMILGSTVWNTISGFMDLYGDRQRNYDTIPPLQGPKGVRLTVYRADANCVTGATVITKALKNPEVAVRWLDYFFTLEGNLEMRIGRQGKEWRYPNPGELSYTGLPAEWVMLSGIGGAQNYYWGQYGIAQYLRHDRQGANQDIYAPDGIERRLYEAYHTNYEPYLPKKALPGLYIPSDVQKKINQPMIDIKAYVQEALVRFCTDDLSLEKDWDSYVATLNKMGLNDIVKAHQDAYNSYLANIAEFSR